jgi:hypothetical protein
MNDPIINKVAESGLITIDPEKFYPREEIAIFDLKDFLFMGLILKEKDFREQFNVPEPPARTGRRPRAGRDTPSG